ncbi:Tripartite ATP-independent periplasmic transporter DctQ component [Ancylobacter novellus DSM 506]|uniref:TRAP transporter small permease protein n=1 Tax=Ancylobacter novellus (strain ATCC 8093 / DSM 506 / JCM 20403 / CCM 1077 / IAM 12100 / NBRC 12443 / NCIMB 10456) TaxID=639283 RepID=D6ZZ72_ANCN5|nr:TRAP transporter small permease [Ancylobacter novellus]ADH89208.1 Tripartite ATP-independent periplasmic transporter DctQ component [Ancylobacter novellus DSM 506]
MNQLLKLAIAAFYRVIEVVMVLCMVVMLVTVFSNVVLRLGFNTGINLSDELPRFAFVWLTFLGAIVGLHRRAHLGVDLVVRALPLLGRKLCWGISQAIMLVCSLYMLYGTWLQHDIIAGNSSPVAQISTLWVYGVSYVTGTAIGLICIANLIGLFLGHVAEEELIDVNEEGMSEVHEIEHELADQGIRKGTAS